MKTLAEKCAIIRESFGLYQWQLAQLIGSNQTEVSFIERGFIPKDCAKIVKIEDLYKRIVQGGR